MKKLFLISFLLFIPMAVYSDTLITSSEQIKAEILPLDSDKLYFMYFDSVTRKDDCRGIKDIRTYFLDGSIPVPFSGERLLKICRKNTIERFDKSFVLRDYCRNLCADFVFDYMKYIAEKAEKENDVGGKMTFDRRLIEVAQGYSRVDSFGGNFINRIQDIVFDGGLKEPFSVKRLRDVCRDIVPVSEGGKCTTFAIEYEELYKLNYPEKR